MNCVFCKIVNGDLPSWKVWENDEVYAFFDINPMSRYHTLVIPKKHYINIFDIPENDLKAVIAVVRQIAKLYKEKLDIEHIQILSNNGEAAGQDVFHLHYHIIPRQDGDNKKSRWKAHPEWRKDFDEMLKKLID
ncbi:MAG: HIT family protein [Saprospiraceae bacterium]